MSTLSLIVIIALGVFAFVAYTGWNPFSETRPAQVATATVATSPTSGVSPSQADAGTATVATAAVVGAVAGAAVVSTAPAWYMGGWLLVEGLTLGMTLLLLAPFFLLFCGVGVLSEWGDPHFNWKKREQDPETTSREYATTILFSLTLLALNWAGVPIWASLKSLWGPNWWYAGAIIPYIGVGIWWCSRRWDDLTQYLNHKRKVRYQETCDSIRRSLEKLLSLQEAIGKCSNGSKKQIGLENERKDLLITVRMNLLGEELARKSDTLPYGQHAPHEIYETPKEFEAKQLDLWIKELQWAEGNEFKYPPEFKEMFVKSDKKPFSIAWQDHGWQMYLWIAFWPMSMTIRVIHKILTLELLKTFFMMIVNRLGGLWDRIAKRNEITIVAIERTPANPVEPDGVTVVEMQKMHQG